MTTRPIDIINKTMTYNSNPTADLVRPLFIVTPYARYVQFNSRVRWLISDDELGMNSEAYEMYVLSKRIRHKCQVKYFSQAPLTRLFSLIQQAAPRAVNGQISDIQVCRWWLWSPCWCWDPRSVWELIHTSIASLIGTPISWFNNTPGLAGWFATRLITVS